MTTPHGAPDRAAKQAAKQTAQRIKVLYIAGSARCGSTLLDRVLGEAPGLLSAGELNLLWRRGLLEDEPCSCHVSVRDCGFWREVFQDAYGGMGSISPERVAEMVRTRVRNRDVVRPVRPAVSQEDADTIARLYAAIARVSGSRVIVDSSKHPAYALLLSAVPQLDLRIVHVVRDSRAVAHSLLKRKVRYETEGRTAYMGVEGRTALGCAWEWTRVNVLTEALRARGLPYLGLRYEDIVRDPRAALTRIGAFIGEPLDAVPLEQGNGPAGSAAITLAGNHAASGNPMRFDTGRIEIVADEAWRDRLPARQRQVVTAFTAPLLRRYGYALSARPIPAAAGAPPPALVVSRP